MTLAVLGSCPNCGANTCAQCRNDREWCRACAPVKTTVEVSTTQYLHAHGRTPRGAGSWAFESVELWGGIRWFQGTYGEAKRAAVAAARQSAADLFPEGGRFVIEVGS